MQTKEKANIDFRVMCLCLSGGVKEQKFRRQILTSGSG